MFKRHGKSKRGTASPGGARHPRLIRRVLAAVVIVGGSWAVLWALNRPIRAVTVTGDFRHVTPMKVERAVAPEALGSGIMTVNLAQVRAAVEALPWVERASVRRVWPGTLAVRVHEQVALARWNRTNLVNRAGVVFVHAASDPPAGLPSLTGPVGTAAQVTRRYLRMSGQLAPEGFSIASLQFNARGTWQFRLTDGITVRLGRSQLDARFEKFVNVALVIVKRRAQDISYIDMRYMNGFAIGWRTGASRDVSSPQAGRRGGRDA